MTDTNAYTVPRWLLVFIGDTDGRDAVSEPAVHGPWIPSTVHKDETYCERCLVRSSFAWARDCDAAKDEFVPPKCDVCGAPVTTGMMAVFCPMKEKCEFWPEDIDSQEFVQSIAKEQP